MSGSELPSLSLQEFRDRYLTPLLVLVGLFVVLTILGYNVIDILTSVSPVWVAIVVFTFLGYRFVTAVERMADAMDAAE